MQPNNVINATLNASQHSIASFFKQFEQPPPTEEKTSECEEKYGPYPRAIPIPYVSKQHDTPPFADILEAKTMYDMQSFPDYRDKGTPDEWVPRDGRLVRLTGRHPFNAEPPIAIQNEHKFITPASLHYVRSHGAIPQIKWEEHTVCVGGPYVSKPLELTMDQLTAMPSHELPVTLVCSANRRKEQNMIAQTAGFNWGPSACATSVFKGVRLRDILLMAGVSEEDMDGKHVEFIGHEDLVNKVGPGPFKEEPWGRLVKYGTSVTLGRAMSPAFDMIVAYEANGEPLQPDHGFPVRIIVPGYTAGRMVKWLKHINVIDHETRNHWHYHDNRLLPPNITAEQGIKEGWFYKPEYIINELNVNSTIISPIHDETVSLVGFDKEFDVGGYAYTGGGRKVTRVEISLDKGKSWKLAEIDRKEKPNAYGMYWCWIWWTYKLRVVDLIGRKEIWCRAWDAASNTQPLNPTWNLLGMGTNHVHRVKIHMQRASNGEHAFRFEHPTQPGQLTGGWMHDVDEKPESAGFGFIHREGKKKMDAPTLMQETASAPVKDIAPAPVKKIAPAPVKKIAPAPVKKVAPPPVPVKKNVPKKVENVEKKAKGSKKTFTMEEVSKHNTKDDVWIVVNKKVYDCTDYLDLHPGGEDSILIVGGEDCTEDFEAIHSPKATKMLDRYYIGDLR